MVPAFKVQPQHLVIRTHCRRRMVAQEEAQEEQGRRRKKKIITCVDGVNEYEEMNGH